MSQVEEKYKKLKNELEAKFKEFHELLQDKILDSNKTPAKKKVESKVVSDLASTCSALEKMNITEGMFSLATIAVRELLTMRDRMNELEYELYSTKKDLLNTRKSLGIADDQKKEPKSRKR